MSYLDEQHCRAMINVTPRYHRIIQPGWLDRLVARFKRPEVTLPLTREEALALHSALVAAVAYADHCKAHGFQGRAQHATLADRYNEIHWDLLKRLDVPLGLGAPKGKGAR